MMAKVSHPNVEALSGRLGQELEFGSASTSRSGICKFISTEEAGR